MTSKWLISGLFLNLHCYWKKLKTVPWPDSQIFSQKFLCSNSLIFMAVIFSPAFGRSPHRSVAAACVRWMGLPSLNPCGFVTFSHTMVSRCTVFWLDGSPKFVHICRAAICACCFALGHLFSSCNSICSKRWCCSLKEAVGLHLALDQGWWKL